MTNRTKSLRRKLLSGLLVTATLAAGTMIAPNASMAQSRNSAGADLALSVGRGRLLTLPQPMADVFVANDKVADIQVRSSTQMFIFGRGPGETSIYATDARGKVIYSAVVRVGNNIETLDQMLALAMPDANIQINSMNGFVLLTGTVAAPQDAAEASRLIGAMVGKETQVISRLQTATPLQVNLQVRVAEVNRTIVKEIGMNVLANRVNSKGERFGVASGNDDAFEVDEETNAITGILKKSNGSSLSFLGKVLGLNLNTSLDLAERSGLVVTLAQPNLTTVSGETADFLAGGEFPVPIVDPQNGSIAITYRRYGVSLAYTPTVLSNGRISMRVRPEVSELSSEGAIKLNGFDVPSLTVRRTETTVELGSGESFMIAGLMSNRSIGNLNKAPGLGDVPVLGNLFKSDSFRRGETELVIMITPYLVKPTSENNIKLPTDAFLNASDLQRIILNQTSDGKTGGARPMPRLEQRTTINGSPAAAAKTSKNKSQASAATPGFDFGN